MTSGNFGNWARRAGCGGLMACTLWLSGSRAAADATWNGSASAAWNAAGNWSASIPGTGTTASFTGTVTNGNGTTTPVDLGTGVTVKGIVFDTAAASAYVLGTTGGGVLTLSNSTPAISMGSAVVNSEVINAPLSISSFPTISNNATSAAATLTLGGSITATATSATSLTLGGTNTGANALLGNISQGTGSLGLAKTGTGTWVLSGTNSYTGGNTVTDGILQFAKEASLYGGNTASWTLANFNVNNGGTTATHGTLAFNVGGAGEFTASDIGTLLAIGAGSGAGWRAGAAVGFDTTNASGGNFTYGSAIRDTNGSTTYFLGVTKLGANKLTLSGANTYTGATTVSAGTLNVTGSLAAASAVSVAGGATLQGTGTVAGATTISSGGILLAGDGAATGTTLTIGGALTAGAGSILEFVLGAGNAHSTLALSSGAANSLGSGLEFTFVNIQAGTYDNLITGLASNPGTEGSWTVTNGGYTATFTFDGANIDATVAAVPEPGTWALALLAGAGLTAAAARRRSPAGIPLR